MKQYIVFGDNGYDSLNYCGDYDEDGLSKFMYREHVGDYMVIEGRVLEDSEVKAIKENYKGK